MVVQNIVERRIIQFLREQQAVYERALTSAVIGEALNLAPSYVREKMRSLTQKGMIQVRRGPKGGYYLVAGKELVIRINADERKMPRNRPVIQIYEELKKEMVSAGQLIKEIRVNGVKTLEEYLGELPEEEIQEIALVTHTLEDLLVDMLLTAREYLPRLHGGLTEAAALFQGGEEGEGSRRFTEAIDGIQWLNSLINGLNPGFLHDQELLGQWRERQEAFSRIIMELLEAWENQDYVLISDLLEYELGPNLEQWGNFFETLLNSRVVSA